MRFEKIFLLYPCYAGQAHRYVRTSLVRRISNLVAKKMHSILNNDKGNLNNNLNFCRFLLPEGRPDRVSKFGSLHLFGPQSIGTGLQKHP